MDTILYLCLEQHNQNMLNKDKSTVFAVDSAYLIGDQENFNDEGNIFTQLRAKGWILECD